MRAVVDLQCSIAGSLEKQARDDPNEVTKIDDVTKTNDVTKIDDVTKTDVTKTDDVTTVLEEEEEKSEDKLKNDGDGESDVMKSESCEEKEVRKEVEEEIDLKEEDMVGIQEFRNGFHISASSGSFWDNQTNFLVQLNHPRPLNSPV